MAVMSILIYIKRVWLYSFYDISVFIAGFITNVAKSIIQTTVLQRQLLNETRLSFVLIISNKVNKQFLYTYFFVSQRYEHSDFSLKYLFKII